MKKIYLILVNTLLFIAHLSAQTTVQITSTGGTGASGISYTSLALAFTAINNGVHTGTVSVNIVGNSAEISSAVLNSSGSGSANYTAVNIQPSGGAARTISCNIAGALIDLNGADNVTIDGLNTGGNSLIMDNQSRSGASTIRVKGDAGNVTIKRCTVKGAGNATQATVYVTTTNDNFWIDDCDITASTTGTPTQAMYLNATSGTDNTKITNCRIYDFHSNAEDVYGIRIGTLGLGTGCTITGNSFYETSSRYLDINKNFYFIGVKTDFITDLTISDNYFGGQTINGGASASPLAITGFGVFSGVYLDIGTSNTASIQNNQMKNISFTTTSSSTNNALISLVTGSFNCGNITGNVLGSGVTANVGGTFLGILAGTGTPGTLSISNNSISGLSVAGVIRAISINKTGSYTLENNQIYNNTVTSGSNLVGIYVDTDIPISPVTTTNIIRNNMIYDLKGNGAGDVYGIEYKSGGTTNTFDKNKIYNLKTTGTTATAVLIGVNVSVTTNISATFSNNMIALANGITGGATIYGFKEATNIGCNYYNNSVYIGGTGVASNGNTYTFFSSNTAKALNIKNNIFTNVRTNSSGTAKNYSIKLATNAALTIDNNLYYGNTASGSGYNMGNYAATDYSNLCPWKTALGTGKETNSLFKDPKFIDPTNATTPDLHIQATTPVESKGVSISGITTDFDGDTRSSKPDIGADEGSFTLDPVVSLASLGGPYCTSDAAITLSGGSPSGTGSSFSGTGVSGTTFTPLSAGAGTFTITYTFTNSVDICNSATQSITVNAQPAAPSVSNVAYCLGETAAALTATGSNLKWYTTSSGGSSSTTAATPITSSVGTTDYYVSQTVSSCESPRAHIIVTVNGIPTSPSVSNASYCVGVVTTALTATGSNLKWYSVASGGTSRSTAPTPSTSINGETNYYVSQTVNNCESPRAQITITVNANLTPSVSISPSSTSICSGSNVTFTATPTNGGSSPNFQWKKNGSNVGTNSATYADASLISSNTITVILTSNETCLASATATGTSATVNVNTLIAALAGANQTNNTNSFTMAANNPAPGIGEWSLLSGTATITNAASATTTITGVPNVSTAVLRWVITQGACVSSSDVTLKSEPVLPLTLLNFDVKTSKNGMILTWRTADEKNVKGFDVQRATNKSDFKSIYWQIAKGDGTYSYEDKTVSNGIPYYYRLKMQDNDTRFEYSPIKAVSIQSDEIRVKVYPNPTWDESYLNIISPNETVGYLTLYNSVGQAVQVLTPKLTIGENSVLFDMSRLTAGVYFMILKIYSKELTIKICKN